MANEKELLVPSDMYLKSGIHIGTKFKTRYMERFIYKTRPDGLSVLNLQRIDERIKVAVQFLSQFAPDDILIISRRENGWKPLRKLNETTGINVVAGRYPPGMLTNPALEIYRESKVVMVTDAWPDRNAILDANQVGVPVVALCDTNNQSNNIDLVIPCNNKGRKSLGLLFFIMAREYLKATGKIKTDAEFKATAEDFTDE
jgi:small subunit ribosomal protein S2|tara:strand:- start:325 stop:927 length:603 start_codon:yes stop_codon:yes gene_type:complete